MNTHLPDDERLLDLLVQEATEGLGEADRAELAERLRAHPELAPDAFAETVGALDASARRRDALPPALARRIVAQAPHAVPTSAAGSAPVARAATGHSGWWAAAACLVLAIAGWWPRIVSNPGVESAAPRSAAQQRDELLSRGNVVQVSLAAGPASDAAPLAGDVIFDPATQTGYLRFRGIPANDPRLAQYQLWIADGARAQPEPVDGGVFDVPSTAVNGDVIIPFRAKLAVGAPAAFVITMEQPGGVVVSRQERVLALAKVDSGA